MHINIIWDALSALVFVSQSPIPATMKYLVVFLSVLILCNAAPAPVPAPGPAPKPNPSLLYAAPILTAPTAVSYSSVYKAPPSYPIYTPYIYNLGYASAYSYHAYPYYIL